MFSTIFLNAQPLSGDEQLELARQAIAAAEKAEKAAAFRAWFLPTITITAVVALLVTVCIIYLVQHRKNRRNPPIERKGANLLGGAYGNGAVGGKPSGAGAFGGVPGASIPTMSSDNDAPEDPRKR